MISDIEPEHCRCKASKNCFRRFLLPAVIMLLVIIYSTFWYIMARRVQERVSANLQSSQQYGITAHCENLRKTGYPLRIAMACDTLTWSRPLFGISFTSNLFVAGAPVYAPHWISLDITAPVMLELPGLKLLEGRWKTMQLEADLDKNRLDSIALAVDQMVISNETATGSEKPVAADFIRIDADKHDDAFNIRLSFDKLLLPFVLYRMNGNIPAMDGVVELQLDNAGSFYMPADGPLVNRIRGHSGNVSKAVFSMESGGRLTVSGPFSVSQEGVLSGRFTVAVGDSSAMMRTLRNLFPEQASNVETIFFALNTMPKNEKAETQLVFDVVDGSVRMGFIRLGDIPPLGQDL